MNEANNTSKKHLSAGGDLAERKVYCLYSLISQTKSHFYLCAFQVKF